MKTNHVRFVRQVCAWLAIGALLIFLPVLALAQSAGTAGLTGTVTDPSGAVIPNVTVTLTSADTNQARTATTAGDGVYKFSLIPPGAYRIRFVANGFKASEVTAITLNVTETPVLNKALEVGSQGESVTVEASSETLQTATSTLGTTVGAKSVTGLPLSNRNYTQILGLSSGVSVGVANATAFGKATQDMSTNGNDPAQNNFQMDGVAINNVANSGSANDSGIYAGIGVPNPDAIAEFKIQTSTYDASYGRNPGANVNVVTKSGTNQIHGTGFEFFRNAQMNANDFFFNREATNVGQKQILNQNQFGGTLGGPIKKDKIFIFGSYQGTRQKNGVAIQGLTSYTYLPDLPLGDRSGAGYGAQVAAANCNLSLAGQNVPGVPTGFGAPLACNGSNINPIALKILQLKNADGSYYIPSSQQFGNGPGQFSQPAIYQEDQVIVNGDYLLNVKNTLAARYFYTRNPQDITLNAQLPGAPTHQYYSNTAAVLKLTTIVTNTFVNELRGSMQRNVASATDSLPSGATSQSLGIAPMLANVSAAGGVQTGPNMTEPPFMVFILNGFNTFGGLNPSFSPTTQMQIADQVSWTHGRQTIRGGFELEKTQWNIVFAGLERGFLLMGSFNDLLVGGPGSIFECLFCVRSGPDGIIHGYRLPNGSAFFQDDIKVSNKLTVNLGIRWEYDGELSDKYGNATNPQLAFLGPNSSLPAGPLGLAANYAGWTVPSNYSTATWGPLPPGVQQGKGTLSIPDHPPYSNFGPRAGFAYQVNSKLVIRGGGGVFYDRVGADRFVHSVEQGNPYAETLDYLPGNNHTLAQPFPVNPQIGTFAQRYLDPNCVNEAGGCVANSSYLNAPFLAASTHTPTVRQYNMTFQYNFAPSWILEAGYVGSSGINLTDYNHNYNSALLASPSNPINGVTTNTVANTLLRAPYWGYQNGGLQGTAYDLISNYNSLQVTVRKQLSKGFLMQAGYTYSKSLTNSFENTANSNFSGNTSQQYGPSYFNRPERLIVNYSYDLPFGKHTGALAKGLGGWNISGVTTVQSGVPLTIIDTRGGTAYGTSSTTIQAGYSRAQLCPGITSGQVASTGSVESRLSNWINPSAFCLPPTAPNSPDGSTLFGDSGPGILRGPGQFNFDATVVKNTRIRENINLQFRAEAFNLFNHPQFSNPNAYPANLIQITNAIITSTSVNPRVLQLALKFIF